MCTKSLTDGAASTCGVSARSYPCSLRYWMSLCTACCLKALSVGLRGSALTPPPRVGATDERLRRAPRAPRASAMAGVRGPGSVACVHTGRRPRPADRPCRRSRRRAGPFPARGSSAARHAARATGASWPPGRRCRRGMGGWSALLQVNLEAGRAGPRHGTPPSPRGVLPRPIGVPLRARSRRSAAPLALLAPRAAPERPLFFAEDPPRARPVRGARSLRRPSSRLARRPARWRSCARRWRAR